MRLDLSGGLLSGNPSFPITVKPVWYQLVSEDQVSVGLAPATTIITPVLNALFLIYLVNSSADGQVIRVGAVPSFSGTVAGIPIQPGDSITITGVTLLNPFKAIADAAGGLLDRLIWRTP